MGVMKEEAEAPAACTHRADGSDEPRLVPLVHEHGIGPVERGLDVDGRVEGA
jgi:hypothetical protein